MTKQLSSLAALAAVFARNGKKVLAQAEAALVEAVEVIQADAKERVGGAGDVGLLAGEQADISSYGGRGRSSDSSALRDSILVEYRGDEVAIGSALDIAACREFGTATNPPSPFLELALAANEEKIVRLIGECTSVVLVSE